jgi:hypothetical protein
MSKNLTTIQRKMLKILSETVEHYSKDTRKRGLDQKGACCFITPQGKKCAIGRLLNKTDLKKIQDKGHEDVGYFAIEEYITTQIVKELPENFICALQVLHDVNGNWNIRSGMTDGGKEEVEHIKENIIRGKY